MEQYNKSFYEEQWQRNLKSAESILPIVLEIVPNINSVVDFGCGNGTWLSALKQVRGGGNIFIQGYDGPWVEKDFLKIPQECFAVAELDKEISIGRKYDLAISIEVAEHLPKESAKTFIKMLTEAADVVLFSAAIPLQGGVNHINEQWQDYWYNIFKQFGYIGIDYLRKRIWNEPDIVYIYKQNMYIYVKEEKLNMLNIQKQYYGETGPINIVHPEIYTSHVKHISYLEEFNINEMPLLKVYRGTIKQTIKKIVGKRIWEWLKKSLKQKNGI